MSQAQPEVVVSGKNPGRGWVSESTEAILKLYTSGGIPLVLVGFGVMTLMFGWGEHPVATGIAICSFGLVAWLFTGIVSALRWRSEMELAKQQEQGVLETVCKVVSEVQDTSIGEKKVQALIQAMKNLRRNRVTSPPQ